MTVDTSQATYSYFAYARGGVAEGVTGTFSESGSSRASLQVDIELAGGAAQATPTVTVYGPGDVVAIDPKQVVRVEPKPGANDWTPNWFPAIEFDRPELPWLFSPYAAASNRLRPWLVLVVVEEREGVTYEENRQPAGRPAITLDGAATSDDPRTVPDIELPDLDDSWAWAHVHVSGNFTGSQLDAENDAHPELVVSRLVSPRRLHAGRRYRACVVPAFEAGRAAGLGEATIASTLAPAWTKGQQTVTLPVYYSWEFGTGLEGDFESLARLLEPMLSPAGVGAQAMDGTQPGGGLPSAGAHLGGLQGALQAPGANLGNPPVKPFVNKLRALLGAGEPSAGQQARPLEVPPPIYGRWPAAATSVPAIIDWRRPIPWLAELNLDPRNRAAAALGTLVVQRRQEQLMASAWAQVGKIDRANQALHQAQLARQAAKATYKNRYVSLSSDAALLLLGSPALPRIQTSGGTLFADVGATRLEPAISPAFRRIARRRGPLSRRAGMRHKWPESAVARLNSDANAALPPRKAPDGTQTASIISVTSSVVQAGNPGALHLDGPMNGGQFKQSAVEVQTGLGWDQRADPSGPPAIDLGQVRVELLNGLDPDKTIPARVASRVKVPASRGWLPKDPLEGIMAAPEFPTPMLTSLRELSQEYVLPGLSNLPPNSVTVLEANNRFINSYMIGLNHEMSRELLWREYPTDQRGTYFRQFWDPSTRVPPPGETTPPDLRDLSPLHLWQASRRLEKGEGAAAFGKLVLVARGQLLRRFPNASVFAIEATAPDSNGHRGLGSGEKWPVFEGRLDPDLTFFGFDLSREQAKTGGSAGQGYFFVIQQHPTEPHYGLEEEEGGTNNVPGGQPQTWGDLSWAQLVDTEDDLTKMSYAPATPPSSATPVDTSGPAWGTDSAQVAAVALRDPVRVAIHARDLVS